MPIVQQFDHLSLHFKLDEGNVRMSERFIAKLEALEPIAVDGLAMIRTLLILAGTCMWANFCVGREMLSAHAGVMGILRNLGQLAFLLAQTERDPYAVVVQITEKEVEQINEWRRITLKNTPLSTEDLCMGEVSANIWADASLKARGNATFADGKCFVANEPWSVAESKLGIFMLELLAAKAALLEAVSWIPRSPTKRVWMLHCDNQGVYGVLGRGSRRTSQRMWCATSC